MKQCCNRPVHRDSSLFIRQYLLYGQTELFQVDVFGFLQKHFFVQLQDVDATFTQLHHHHIRLHGPDYLHNKWSYYLGVHITCIASDHITWVFTVPAQPLFTLPGCSHDLHSQFSHYLHSQCSQYLHSQCSHYMGVHITCTASVHITCTASVHTTCTASVHSTCTATVHITCTARVFTFHL